MTKPRQFTITLHEGPADGRVLKSLFIGREIHVLVRERGGWGRARYAYSLVDTKAWTASATYIPTPRKRKKGMKQVPSKKTGMKTSPVKHPPVKGGKVKISHAATPQ